ncbi:sulfite exporter TauE/SafE family protein [Bacillus smithii]|uniref:sulfite exporter TauE/SafE family protein n=1 Tax=Bacillus smithii TaxID=1479 RepID=UPI0030C952C5
MQKLIVLALVGLAAQLVDGSLGMGYGLTSTSLLLLYGIAPAAASASVHLAEVVTTAASGISHIRFGNIDKEIVLKLIIPGSIGAFLGATVLSNLPGDVLKPYISIFLLLLGVYIIFRFIFRYSQNEKAEGKKVSKKLFVPLGFIAGFFDATGGGGWGPIATPTLLSKKDLEPRKVIGSVDTSEFAVSLASSIGFLLSLGANEINWIWTLALMIGGLIAAPIAAFLIKIIPSHLLGVLVGGMIIYSNMQTLLKSGNLSDSWITFANIAVFLAWALSALFVMKKHRNLAAQNSRFTKNLKNIHVE